VLPHVVEVWLAPPQLAETEGEILAVRVQLREESGGVAVGGEELDDGFEVDGTHLMVERRALGACVLEESWCWAAVLSVMGSICVRAGPSGP
jgi:hypothetical protein